MAATLGHHQLHFQQQIHHQQIQQQPSPPSPPKSTSSSTSSSSSSSSSSGSSHSSFLHADLAHSSDHFCKDCGVMFESSTSLEVHLSYHKENLLTRWANQDSNSSEKSVVVNHPSSSPHTNNSSASSLSSEPSSMSDMSTSGSSTNSHPPTPHSIDGNSGSGAGSASQQQQRFFPNNNNNNSGGSEPHHGQFPPVSQYGNAAANNEEQQQQHSMDHAYRQPPAMSSSNSFNQPPPPPVELNSHINGNLAHHSPYHAPIMIAQNHIFSPNHNALSHANHHSQQQPPPGGEQQHRPPPNTEQSTAAAIRESAEILDLDSHKVHVYQPPIPADRHFFHNPYGLPTMFGNGWSHGIPPEHQFSHGHHPPPPPHPGFGEHHSIPAYAMHGQHPPGQPPPHHPPPTSVYDIDRNNPQFPPEQSSMDYPPPTSQAQAPPPPPTSAQTHGGLPPFGQPSSGPGFTPMAAQPADNRQERISMSSPLAPSPAQKSPNEATTPGGSAASVAAKTKGWKGGECKRPKTYNCTACNKWFTSSGHLKRHYGTTLHKNSIKQKDLPDEQPPPPKRGKNGMNKQAAAAAAAVAAAANNNNATADVIRDRSPMKDFLLKGNEGSNGRSGYIPSPPIIHSSPAPPKISPQRQVDDMDKANGSSLHKPPGHMVGSSPAFNIPSGFKYDTQALNAENNTTIEHPNPGYLSQPPSQQRLFNPGMAHHHQFYSMPHAPPPFMNGFAPDPTGIQNGPPPPSSQ